MKTFYYALLCTFVLTGCKAKNSEKEVTGEILPEEITEEQFVAIPELTGEEVFLKDKNPFGDIIELKGEQIVADTVIFKVGEPGIVIKDNTLVMKTGHSIMIFSLPDFKFLGYTGSWGRGPDEFIYPSVVPTDQEDLLCYMFEATNQKLYSLDKQGNLSYYPFLFDMAEKKGFSDKALVNVGPDDFVYADTSPTGKSIYRATADNDSAQIRMVYNLGLNPKRKSPFAYIGDFVVNAKQNRMAYAYKYFKIIKFMDMEAQTVKTINFELEKFDENTLYKVDGLDQNVTHYWGACAQDKYVYFLYSGRTPMNVMKDNQKNPHIFVEQYDWNGTPIHKYKLDQWGYFTVDEANGKIYLLSTNHDDPFFVYDLKEL